MSGQTKDWWLEDVSLRRLDGPMRRQLAKRNRSAIGVLTGLGVRSSELVSPESPPRAPEPWPNPRIVPVQPPRSAPRPDAPRDAPPVRPHAGPFLMLLASDLRSTARAQRRDVGAVVGEEFERVGDVMRAAGWLLLLLLLVSRH